MTSSRHSAGYPFARRSAFRLPPSAFRVPRRRGVLLLVILGLLAMFGLVAVTFVITTGHFRRSAQALQRVDQFRDDPKALLDEAFAQCVRGSNNVGSAIGPHSLLEDIYGNDPRVDFIAPTDTISYPPYSTANSGQFSGQFLRFTAHMFTVNSAPPTAVPTNFPLPAPWLWADSRQLTTPSPMNPAKSPEQCSGSVVTFYNGRCAGMSGRIVAVLPTPNTTFAKGTAPQQDFVVMANSGMMTLLQQDILEGTTVFYVINGMPFSGTGFGLNAQPVTARAPNQGLYGGLNATYTAGNLNGLPYALLPNPAYFPRTQPESGWNQDYPDPAGPGGANEDYDAPDYQNMLLAMVRPPVLDASGNPDAVPVPIPSLHRPELINYWLNQSTASYTTNLALQRATSLRPIGVSGTVWDHSLGTTDPTPFNGSNPNYQANWDGKLQNSNASATPQWDVDNDGDGIPDSIWVDLGLPARAAPDGRMYKPLFAILCTDLDGRLNLNAHGNLAQAQSAYYQAGPAASTQNPGGCYAGTTGATPISLPRGQGFGPADINLGPLFANSSAPSTTYLQLLSGISSYALEGRYGELGMTPAGPGQSNMHSPLWMNKNYYQFLNPNGEYAYYNRTTANQTLSAANASTYLSVFGTPPDPYGTFVMALDIAGRPLYGWTANTNQSWSPAFWAGGATTINTPYEMNLSRDAAWAHYLNSGTPISTDHPFTPAELERALRPYDVDTNGLPGRIAALLQLNNGGWTASNNNAWLDMLRQMTTTESVDVPCPSAILPREFYQVTTAPAPYPNPNPPTTVAHLADLFYDVQRDYVPAKFHCNTTNPRTLVDFFPRELLAGRRMDLNRPLGAGVAVQSPFVVDAPIVPIAGVPPTPPPPGTVWNDLTQIAQMLYNRGSASFTGSSVTLTPPSPSPANYNSNDRFFLWKNGRTPYATPGPDQESITFDNPRTRYARDLYLVAMAIAQLTNYQDPAWQALYPTLYALDPTGGLARARAIAQWAVNVVDFRDRDSIMTCFVYDPDPFNMNGPGGPKYQFQWRPTGDPSIQGLYGTTSDNGITTPHVVWGCEFPPLLITETFAIHDRRTQDTADETTFTSHTQPAATTLGKPADPDFDQVTRPQGSLFVELYNPTSPYDGPAPELEVPPNGSTNPNNWSVKLDAWTPTGASPVWRLLILAPIGTAYGGRSAMTLPSQPTNLTPTTPTYFTPDPDDPLQAAYFSGAARDVRYAYFVPLTGYYGEAAGAVRYCPSAANKFPVIPPGRYAVIGPGQPNDLTKIGGSVTCISFNNDYPLTPTTTVKQAQVDGARKIILKPQTTNNTTVGTAAQQVYVYSSGGTTTDDLASVLSATKPAPLAFIIDAVAGFSSSANSPPRLSVSEPFEGYPLCDINKNTPLEQYKAIVYDMPLDKDTTKNDGNHHAVWNNCLKKTATFPFFGMVYLQRLANPTVAWDRYSNPYRTIDSMQVDLTCFNGISPAASLDPDDPVSAASALANVSLTTRERGGYARYHARTTPTNLSNLWAHEPEVRQQLSGPLSAGANKPYVPTDFPASTYLTVPVAPAVTAPSICNFKATFSHSLGYLNKAFGFPRTSPAGYEGAPPIPFPALVWNNRPFANAWELLLVPQCSSSQLLSSYSGFNVTGWSSSGWSSFWLPSSNSGGTTTPTYNPYTSITGAAGYFGYGCLTNPFYNSASFSAGAGASPLLRLLDYVEVPSPFVSARTQLDPSDYSSTSFFNSTSSADLPFFMPFNWVSNYRDPGKMNLNTIYSRQAWQGLTNYFPDVTNTSLPTPAATTLSPNMTLWAKFVRSRRGFLYTSVPPAPPAGASSSTEWDMLRMDPAYPTRFVNPFRSPSGAWLVPPVPTGAYIPTPGTPPVGTVNYIANAIGGEVNTGLLRAELLELSSPPSTQPTPPNGPWGTRPLFQFDTSTTSTPGTPTPLYSATTWPVPVTDPSHPLNPDRNPCFRYQLIDKLSNTTTTRSNVYAVWITVGYFEVRPGPMDAAHAQFHPDGYYLGQELGSDTGDVHRHRAFYIFDRSVPMGFVRGMDLNLDKGVLIKRFIE